MGLDGVEAKTDEINRIKMKIYQGAAGELLQREVAWAGGDGGPWSTRIKSAHIKRETRAWRGSIRNSAANPKENKMF